MHQVYGSTLIRSDCQVLGMILPRTDSTLRTLQLGLREYIDKSCVRASSIVLSFLFSLIHRLGAHHLETFMSYDVLGRLGVVS
jgi:hypothetical protein